ncbi:MAG: hypothetical protein JSV47_13380 [Deltaproteobacteria bacterium]|nr:MAG: hypothetical protein JSV47_13380 [Deltaproteobacteria bacterium]
MCKAKVVLHQKILPLRFPKRSTTRKKAYFWGLVTEVVIVKPRLDKSHEVFGLDTFLEEKYGLKEVMTTAIG